MNNTDMQSNDNEEITKLFITGSNDSSTVIKRIKYILSFYSEWMANDDPNKESMYHIINYAFNFNTGYNFNSFLADYHFIVREKNAKLVASVICEIENDSKDEESICDAEICRVIDRSNDLESRALYYCKADDDSQGINRDISVQKILDSLHMFLYHTFRLNPNDSIEEQLEKEYQNDLENEKWDDLYHDKTAQKVLDLIEKAKSTSKRFRRSRNTSNKQNKFMTFNQFETKSVKQPKPLDMDPIAVYQSEVYGNKQLLLQEKQKEEKQNDNVCVRDTLRDKLEKLQDTKTLNAFETYLEEEEFDSDAIEDDLEFKYEDESNLKHILLDTFEAAALCIHGIKFDEDSKHNVYDAGFRFFYWPYYQHNEDKSRLIYETNRATLCTEENEGYQLKDWFVAKKYDNLKQELTQNKTKPFSMDCYNEVIETASLKLNAYKSDPATSSIICKVPYFESTYGIKQGTEISLKYIVALLCYTNYTEHCYEFSRSFRRIDPDETDKALKERHREFYHWGRALRECIECFGMKTKDVYNDVRYFYHGISRSMLLNSTFIRLYGPVSTTSQYQTAVSRFAQNGIVLQIKNWPFGEARFWPCLYWSCYTEEYEYLFIGGMGSFFVATIRDVPNMQRYDPLIRGMNILDRMMKGYTFQGRKITKKDVNVIRSLIKEEQNNTLLKSAKTSIPKYFLSLFHFFLNKVPNIYIDFHLMNTETNGSYDDGSYGYKLLVPILCLNNNPFSLNYPLLSLMSNTKSFIVYYPGYWGTWSNSVLLNQEFISCMTQAIILETKCEIFSILNPSIPESKSLDDFINKQQQTFNKYGWKLEKDTAFKHPHSGYQSYETCTNTLLIKRL